MSLYQLHQNFKKYTRHHLFLLFRLIYYSLEQKIVTNVMNLLNDVFCLNACIPSVWTKMPNSHFPTWRDETASDASRRAGRAVWTGVKTDWCGSACVLVRRRSWVAARPEWVGRCRRRSWQSRLLEEPADDWELRARTVAVNTWRHQSSRSPSVYTGCANKSGATDSRTQFCQSEPI